MIENAKEISFYVLVLPLLAMFSHIIAALALAPVLYVWKAKTTIIVKSIIFLVGIPILWGAMVYTSDYAGQFFQSPATIGLIVGAMVSTIIMFACFDSEWYENRSWLQWGIMLALPISGFFIGAEVW